MGKVRCVLVAAGTVAALATGLPPAAAGPVAEAASGVQSVAAGFTARPPLRVLDTRDGTGQGGVGAPVGPGAVTTLDLSALVPTATAVVLNLTGVLPTADTYVTLYPAGGQRSGSHLNLVAGQVRPTLVTVAVGADRRLDLFNAAGSVHLVADLAGHYATDAVSRYTPVPSERIYDSQSYHYGGIGPGGTVTVDLSTLVPASATAVTFNLTAVGPTADTFITAWPHGAPRPTASNLNPAAGEVVPNLVTVAVGANRRVDLYNHGGAVRLLVDLAGFATPDYGALFVATPQTRVLDTRDGTGTWTGQPRPVGADQNIWVRMTGRVPQDAVAALLTVVAVDATAPTYVTAWDQYTIYPPSVSTLNVLPGRAASNLASVPISAVAPDLKFDLYNRFGSVQAVADLAGYFVLPASDCLASCGLKWSHGPNGRLTHGPLPVAGSGGVTRLAGGRIALMAGGTVRAMGRNTSGQLGNGWFGRAAVPVMVPVLGLTGVTAVAAGGATGYALRTDGTVWAWGGGYAGQLGTGRGGRSQSTPVQVPGLAGITAIASHAESAYALGSDGTVWSWGFNRNGELGRGSTGEPLTPGRVAGLTGVVGIAAGGNSSGDLGGGVGYAVRSDGTVWAWGTNATGMLGNGGECPPDGPYTCGSAVPVQVSGLTGVTAIASDALHTVALRSDGTVWSWGNNYLGRLGNGVRCDGGNTTCRSTVPTPVSGLAGVTGIATFRGGGHALLGDGSVMAWGYNGNAELGNETVWDFAAVPVPALHLVDVTALGGDATAIAG